MSEVDRWLAARRPASPRELAVVLHEELSAIEERAVVTADAMSEVARACLQRARSRSGRTREAAFALLTADALVTYACEVALESDDPDAALLDIVRVGEGA